MGHIIKNMPIRPGMWLHLKNFLTVFCALFLLGFLLIHPAESLSCAKAGMTLWLNTLIPTLLPFIILTGILTRIDNIQKILSPFTPVFRILFGVSIWGGYVFILGMLCGYPLGAKLASDLYEAHKIGKKEAVYLTTFCSSPSPAFIITYLGKLCLGNTVPVFLIFVSLLSADLICMLLFRFVMYKDNSNTEVYDKERTSSVDCSEGNIFDNSIMNGFEAITRLGGYILLFSLLAGCIRYYHPFPAFYQYLLLCFTEITTGLSIISTADLPAIVRVIISVSATASGGLCILAQTKSMLHHDLSLLPYIISKCIIAVLAAVILYCLL